MVGFSNATTCALLLHLLVFFYLPTTAVSLAFEYPTFSSAGEKDIKIEGNASFGIGRMVISGNKDGPDSYGRASYNLQPVQLWDKATGEVASFTTRFSFAISGGDGSSKGGMAFFLAGYPSSLPDNCPTYRTSVQVDCPAYKLGLTNQSTDAVAFGDSRFVAVEFNTFNNTLVSDPDKTYDHIGIDVNSLRSVKTKILPSSSLIGSLSAMIQYDGVSSNLTVTLWLGDDADGLQGGQSYSLSHQVDLKTALPEQVSIGFSAATSSSISPQPTSYPQIRIHTPGQPISYPPLTPYPPDQPTSYPPLTPYTAASFPPLTPYTPGQPTSFPPPYTPASFPPLTPSFPPLTPYTPGQPTSFPPPIPNGPPQFEPQFIVLGSWYFNSSLEQRSAPPTAPGPRVIAGAVVGATMFLVFLFATAASLVVCRRRRKILDTEEDYTVSKDEGEPMSEIEMGTGPRRFPYHELVEATRNFAAEEKLGQGGFGAVYQGYLREPAGLAVAIKRLQSSIQGKKEYKSEVKVISRLRHRNLVQLIGWCHGHDQELLLVYELMPNRSLDIHLHGKQGTFLTWEMRMKILLELGSALLYLHEEWEQCVLHRDIKPSNVMLDESFGAKLGDFGLARLVDHAAGMQTMTAISGTPGYLDPDCVNTGKASAESDVYSFGVVLLEVACGRRPMSITAADQDKQKSSGVFRLVEWVWGLYGQGMILEAADERLNGDYNAAEVERVMVVGLWCAHPNPSVRPSIRTAMATLQPKVDQAYQLPVLPSKMPVPMYEPTPPLAWANVVGVSSSSTSSSMPMHTSCTTTSDASTSTNSSKTCSSLLKHQ